MTLNQLQYFQTVARCENYHLAASKLYISQPSLSKSINALEKELGTALFERIGRSITLTKSGALFLKYADQILNNCDVALYKMKELSNAGGRIDAGYVFPLAGDYIPRTVKAFLKTQKQEEKIIFSFTQDVTDGILSGVRTGRLDVGFCSCEKRGDDLEFFPVTRQNMVMIVPTDHPLAEREEASIIELKNYPLIGYHRSSMLNHHTRRAFQAFNIQPEIVCECPDEYAIQSMVRAGFGVALVAASAVEKNPSGIRVLRLSDMSLPYQIYMIYLKDRWRLPCVSCFIDFIKNNAIAPD